MGEILKRFSVGILKVFVELLLDFLELALGAQESILSGLGVFVKILHFLQEFSRVTYLL